MSAVDLDAPSTRKLNFLKFVLEEIMLTSQAVACAMAPWRRLLPVSNLLCCRLAASAVFILALLQGPVALAQAQGTPTAEPAGEANLHLPDLSSVDFLGISGHSLLLIGLKIGRASCRERV